MHPDVFREFDRICAERGAGGAVLEVGAVPSADSLLNLPSLAGCQDKTGISLDGPASWGDFNILKVNANDLGCFPDGRFDTVLCNSVLEHDPFFWRSALEMRRVTRSGGLIAVGVPGIVKLPFERMGGRLGRNPLIRALSTRLAEALRASTLTLLLHDFPSDYYRFSVRAMTEIILEGLKDIRVASLLVPPRIIGSGIKP